MLTAAHLFDETALFQKLANGQDPLNGLHANTTIPKLTGAMQRYVAYTEDEDLYNSLSADEQGKLTPELRAKIEDAAVMQRVEDLYKPYKKKRATRASKARDAGLEPLALLILAQGRSDKTPLDLAAGLVNAEAGFPTPEAALQGAQDIVAEAIADDAEHTEALRNFTKRTGALAVEAVDPQEKTVYEAYYDFSEPLSRIPNHRVLAVNRGEKEGKLRAKVRVDADAAIEQLDVWGQRAGVPVIKRDRGSDPASVCYDVLDEADKRGSDLVLIDTAGRLHTSPELMRELAKVVNVTRKRAANMAAGPMPVSVVLVIDAATGQNGLNQALEFNEALGLDGIIMTKLDGTAKGGIAMAVAEKLKLPILRIGVGEQVDDLQEFNAKDFCRALVGESN